MQLLVGLEPMRAQAVKCLMIFEGCTDFCCSYNCCIQWGIHDWIRHVITALKWEHSSCDYFFSNPGTSLLHLSTCEDWLAILSSNKPSVSTQFLFLIWNFMDQRQSPCNRSGWCSSLRLIDLTLICSSTVDPWWDSHTFQRLFLHVFRMPASKVHP